MATPPSESERTAGRILDAAKEEFAAEGFAGARVDAIARLAGCNKQLIYHYFGDKEGLFKAVMSDVLSDKPPVSLRTPADFADSVSRIFEDHPKRRLWMRLLMWESLRDEERPVVGEAERCAHGLQARADMQQVSDLGLIDPAFPRPVVFVAIFGMTIFPWVLPQLVRHITGMNPSDPTFRKQYAEAIRMIVRRLGSPKAGS